MPTIAIFCGIIVQIYGRDREMVALIETILDKSSDKDYKPIILLVEGTSTGDGRLMRVGAVPGMGFVIPFAGGSETRPAGPDAGLRGARCPGGGRSDPLALP